MYVLGFAETKKDTTWYNYTIVATPIHTSLQWFTVPCWGTWKNFLRYFCGQSWASSSAQDLTQLLLNCWQMLKNHWTIYIPSIHLLYLLLHLLLSTSVIHAILNQSNPKWPYFSDLVNASDTKDIRPQEHQNMRPLPSSTNSTRLSRLCRGSCSTWQCSGTAACHAKLMGYRGKSIRRVRLAPGALHFPWISALSLILAAPLYWSYNGPSMQQICRTFQSWSTGILKYPEDIALCMLCAAVISSCNTCRLEHVMIAVKFSLRVWTLLQSFETSRVLAWVTSENAGSVASSLWRAPVHVVLPFRTMENSCPNLFQ